MHALRLATLACAALALAAVPAHAQVAVPADTTAPGAKFFSAEDGKLDLSSFMASRFGFVPIVFPITEPAVGYGAGAVVAFVDKPPAATQAGFGRPDISLLGGLATENGTWLVMAGDIRYWRDDRLKTVAAGAFGTLELDFGGLGTETTESRPLLHYSLAPDFLTLQAMARLGQSRLWAGLRYAFAASDVQFTVPAGTPGLPTSSAQSDVGSLAPSLVYDARDNNFTPVSGTYAEAYYGVYRDWLGSDDEFQSAQFIGIQYVPLPRRFFLGLRADAKTITRGAPFYVHPYVAMRGVPAMRYQGEVVLQAEAELRWQCLGRWSLVGFGGVGTAANDLERLGGTRRVQAGGAGFRYELARRFSLHSGIDLAWGPDDAAIYLQFGSAWGRP